MSDGQTWAAGMIEEDQKSNRSDAMTSPIERMVDEACGVNKPGVPSLGHEIEALDRQSKALLQLADAAENWWGIRRPTSFDEQQHIDHPTINRTGVIERELARAVASWIVVTRNPVQEQCDDNT